MITEHNKGCLIRCKTTRTPKMSLKGTEISIKTRTSPMSRLSRARRTKTRIERTNNWKVSIQHRKKAMKPCMRRKSFTTSLCREDHIAIHD